MPPELMSAFAPDRWPAFVLISARLGGMMSIAPLWSMTVMPGRIRAAITVILALVLLPLAPSVHLPDQAFELPVPLALEMVIGLVIGLTAAVFTQGVQLAGEVLSLQMGLSLGPQLAPMPDLEAPGVAPLPSFLALLLYVGAGGHLILLRGVADSLQSLPPGGVLDLEVGGRTAALLVGAVFDCAVRTAAPVMVALLVTNIALAFLNRAVPQLNAMMVSFPVTIAVGLLMLGATLPFFAHAFTGWMQTLQHGVDTALESLRPAGGR